MTSSAIFEGQRGRLKRLAYRMLGSLADAEDVVQDAWLRWSAADTDLIEDPTAWLVRVATRLCLDRLRADRTRRESYVGPWLPEPLVESPADPVERAEEVSVAFLLALQRLSPLERAVFLLHDVFDQDYATVAATLDREEATCRQLASRARGHLKSARPRFAPPPEAADRLTAAFLDASQRNDLGALTTLLAEDCVLISDGGGKRPAALRPMIGREDVLGLIRGLSRRGTWPPAEASTRTARINGLPGFVVRENDGWTTIALEADEAGAVAAIYIVRNPDKLRALETAPAKP
jgi:RNA polymerase sigma-70 factor (ECF subfamily)